MTDQTPQPWERVTAWIAKQSIARPETEYDKGWRVGAQQAVEEYRAAHAADAARLQQQEQQIVGMRRWMWQGWQPIETAPTVHPLNGGDALLLGWNAPGVNEWIAVVGQWRGEWMSGANKAYPTHWMPLPAPPVLASPDTETK